MKAVDILSRVSATLMLVVLVSMTALTSYAISVNKPHMEAIDATFWLFHNDRQLLLELERENSIVQSLFLNPRVSITKHFEAAHRNFVSVLNGEIAIEPQSDRSMTDVVGSKQQAYVRVAHSLMQSVAKGDLASARASFKTLLRQNNDLAMLLERNSTLREQRGNALMGTHFGFLAYLQFAFLVGGIAAVLILGGLLSTIAIYKRRADRMIREQMEQLEIAALTDSLTQLSNQRAFYKDLPVETSRARRHDRPLTLVLIDIDEFKKINDTQGHNYGDFIISTLGQALKKMREHDRSYRIGGDEMAIILPETGAAQALEALERLREDARRALFGATVSIGFAQLRGDELIQNLYERADAALYEAKHRGRNTIVNFNDISSPEPRHTSEVA